MHDVAKTVSTGQQMKSVAKKMVLPLGGILLLVVLIAGLKALGVAGPTIVVTVLTVVLLVCGILSFRAFRNGRTTAGAIWAVACLLLVLADVKVSQIRKMMSTPFSMPSTAVSSAVVKEEDWAPILSAVGSISPVQGAIVSTELAGVVNKVNFPNGGEAKKGDILIELDISSEEAQLHTAEADLELARANLERTRGLAERNVVSKSEPTPPNQITEIKRDCRSHALDDRKEGSARAVRRFARYRTVNGTNDNAGDKIVALMPSSGFMSTRSAPTEFSSSRDLEVRVTTRHRAVSSGKLLRLIRWLIRSREMLCSRQLWRIPTTCCDRACLPTWKWSSPRRTRRL
jgi:hypothetical protein